MAFEQVESSALNGGINFFLFCNLHLNERHPRLWFGTARRHTVVVVVGGCVKWSHTLRHCSSIKNTHTHQKWNGQKILIQIFKPLVLSNNNVCEIINIWIGWVMDKYKKKTHTATVLLRCYETDNTHTQYHREQIGGRFYFFYSK